MGLYYDGYHESLQKVLHANLSELIDLLNALQGTEMIEDLNDIEAVRQEAIRQHAEDWTDKSSTEYQTVQLFTRAMKRDLYRTLP